MHWSHSHRSVALTSRVANSSKITKSLYRKQWRRMLNKRVSARSTLGKEQQMKKRNLPKLDVCTSPVALYQEPLCTEDAESSDAAVSPVATILDQSLLFVPATASTYDNERALTRAFKPLKAIPALHIPPKTLTEKVSKKWPSISNIPRLGLRNQGAVCYRRAVMQALLNVPLFVNWAASIARKHSDPKDALKCPTEGCTVCALNKVSNAVWNDSRTTAGPATRLFDNAVRGWHGRRLIAREEWMRQEYIHADAREFFMALVGVLQADSMLNSPPSIVEDLFSLRLRRESVCSRCKHRQVSTTLDNESTILIQLHDERNVPYRDPIAAYFSETISAFRCESCGLKADRTCMRCIEAAPEVLVLAINVFSIDKRGVGHKNQNARMNISETLDLSRFSADPRIRSSKKVLDYHLSSVICHSGSVRGGHYVNYSMSPGSGIHMYDDSVVRKRSRTQLFEGERLGGQLFTPYVLTYVRDG